MKKFAILAALTVAFFVSACSTTPQQASSLQGKIAAACPVVQVAIADTQAIAPSLSPEIQDGLKRAAPVVAQVCAANASIDTASLQSLVQTGLPALIADVNAAPLTDGTKAKVVTALALAQIALTAVVQFAPQPVAAIAPAPQ